MDFKKWFNEAVAIIKLDENAIERTAIDAEATLPALLVPAVAGLASAIGWMNPIGLGGILLGPILLAVFSAIFWLLAKLFGGQGEITGILRPYGLSNTLQWIAVIPIVGPPIGMLASVWLIAVLVVIIRRTQKISTGAACGVVAIPLVICCGALAALFVLGVGGALLAGMMAAGAQ